MSASALARPALSFVGLIGLLALACTRPLQESSVAFVVIASMSVAVVLGMWSLEFLDRRRHAARLAALEHRATLLEGRNRSMAVVLDNVQQGLVIIDFGGTIASEWSATLHGWFGEMPTSKGLVDCVRDHDPDCTAWLELGLEALREGTMPAEITMGQLPRRLSVGERTLSLAYDPVLEGPEVARLLVTITDVTGVLEGERAVAAQRDHLGIFELLFKDRNGVINFLEEGSVIVDEIAATEATSPTDAVRLIHTLKGNASQFGISAVANACHDVEERLKKTIVPTADDRRLIEAAWQAAAGQIRPLLGTGAGRGITIDETEYRKVLDLARGQGHGEILAAMAEWDRDPVQARLDSLGAFAKRLAQRLGKQGLETSCEGRGRGLDHAAWAPFWSSCVHVIRNAVDHGIEDADERALRGKAPGGRITLRADVVDQSFIVTIADDGAGINWSKLEYKAMDEGLPFDTAEERLEVLFCDGMSTKTVASDISGRGVGLSAFRAEVVRRHGTLDVTTQRGEGTTFTARFPIAEPSQVRLAA